MLSIGLSTGFGLGVRSSGWERESFSDYTHCKLCVVRLDRFGVFELSGADVRA